jgi:hypothetical protein
MSLEEEVFDLPAWPQKIPSSLVGRFVISCAEEVELEAIGPEYRYLTWFKTPVCFQNT